MIVNLCIVGQCTRRKFVKHFSYFKRTRKKLKKPSLLSSKTLSVANVNSEFKLLNWIILATKNEFND